jgi:hypothetical protein
MKVIFLDIDGVLNCDQWFHERREAGREVPPTKELNEKAVAVLNEIICRSGAKVVISSSWRLAFSLSEIRGVLVRAGFEGEIYGKTPRRTTYPARRGNEIQDFLNLHPYITEFVILDDDADMEHLLPKLVNTSWSRGLLPEHVAPALKHLGCHESRFLGTAESPEKQGS